jgi:hypothetical protein
MPEKGVDFAELPEIHPAGAKAQSLSVAFTARLKSCPDTKPGFSAACLAFEFIPGFGEAVEATPD